MEQETEWPCKDPVCIWKGSRPAWKLHTQQHSLGKSYCGDCQKFYDRLDKHQTTQTHIKAIAAKVRNPQPEVQAMYSIAQQTIAQHHQTQAQLARPYVQPTVPHAHLMPDTPQHQYNYNDILEPSVDPSPLPTPLDFIHEIEALQAAIEEPVLQPKEDFGNEDSDQFLGRPERWNKYENAVSCAFMCLCRQLQLGRTTIDALLKFVHHEKFDPRALAPTYYLLTRVEDATIPKTPTHVCKLSSGTEVYLKFPSELVALVMSEPNADSRFVHNWSFNNGYIDNPWHCDGWLYDSALFKDFIVHGYPYK